MRFFFKEKAERKGVSIVSPVLEAYLFGPMRPSLTKYVTKLGHIFQGKLLSV